jgi:AcrR family transcriptional regulator
LTNGAQVPEHATAPPEHSTAPEEPGAAPPEHSADMPERVAATPEPVKESNRRSAHRPSRRHEIVNAAVRVFAHKGYADAGIQDIAAEAGVAPTAVYYHYTGKEELFDLALRQVLDKISAVVVSARPDDAPADLSALTTVIEAVWEWIEQHPDEARMFWLHTSGATSQARIIRQQFEQRHVQRAFDYVSSTAGLPRSRRSAAARHAAQTLAVRSFISSLIYVSVLRLPGGPLAELPSDALRKAVIEVTPRFISMD